MDTRVFVLGLVALMSACHQSAGVSPPANGVSGLEAPRFDVLQVASRFGEQEDAIFAGINAFRAQHGLSALTESEALRRFSLAHATDMVTRNYFSHTNPEGQGPYHRLKAANIPFTAYGATNSYASIRASAVIADWEAHPGKHFMLDRRYTQCGVGVAGPAANGRYRVTATYIRP
ncbi:MAG: CAP domain-containing protein [Candidatus Sericytochromatia bacterium]